MSGDRFRRWFIEINPQADCYNSFKDYLNGVKGFYAYIYHDKDINDDGTPKNEHFHLCLDFSNPRTFEQVKKIFVGAHIERPKFWESSIQYLCHKNDPNKYQYDRKEVITNDIQTFNRAFDNVIIQHFDFNNLRNDFIECQTDLTFNDGKSIIYWLVRKYPNDVMKIIKNQKYIIEYWSLLIENDDSLLKEINDSIRDEII